MSSEILLSYKRSKLEIDRLTLPAAIVQKIPLYNVLASLWIFFNKYTVVQFLIKIKLYSYKYTAIYSYTIFNKYTADINPDWSKPSFQTY